MTLLAPGQWETTRTALRVVRAAGVPLARYGAERRVIDAEHEAAHAVVALLLGCRVLCIEIDYLPVTRWRAAPTPEASAMVLLAGETVEDAYRRRVPLADRIARTGDTLHDLAVFARHPELQDRAADLYRAASRMLAESVALHVEIAEAVYAKGRLTASDVLALPRAGAIQRACG